MFDDLISEKNYIICPLTQRPRYIEKGEACSQLAEDGCRKFMVTGDFNCINE